MSVDILLNNPERDLPFQTPTKVFVKEELSPNFPSNLKKGLQ